MFCLSANLASLGSIVSSQSKCIHKVGILKICSGSVGRGVNNIQVLLPNMRRVVIHLLNKYQLSNCQGLLTFAWRLPHNAINIDI